VFFGIKPLFYNELFVLRVAGPAAAMESATVGAGSVLPAGVAILMPVEKCSGFPVFFSGVKIGFAGARAYRCE
jgi:hypothetical protein